VQKKILIVEDDHPIALGLKINLESEGFSTAIIHDGNKAMESFELENPDLILLDVMLPGKSGFEICESIRSSGSTVPILFLTARTLTDDRIRGLELGGDDYISKPFDLRELLLRIKAILKRH